MFTLIVTTVANPTVTSIEDFENCHLVSCTATIMFLYLFNSYVKILSAPAVKRLLTFHVIRFQFFFLFRETFRSPDRIRKSGRFITMGFSTGNAFTQVGA